MPDAPTFPAQPSLPGARDLARAWALCPTEKVNCCVALSFPTPKQGSPSRLALGKWGRRDSQDCWYDSKKTPSVQPSAAGSLAEGALRETGRCGGEGISAQAAIYARGACFCTWARECAKPPNRKGQSRSLYRWGGLRRWGRSHTSGQLQLCTYRRGHWLWLWPLPDFWRWWPVGSLSGPLTGPLPCQCPGSLQIQHRLCSSWTGESQPWREEG